MESKFVIKKELTGNRFFQMGIVLLTFLIIVFAIGLTSPPSPKGEEAPGNEFSAARAYKHTNAISQKPHMIGTEENKRVAAYLSDELKRIGWEVDVQQTTALNIEDVPIFGRITNVIGRLKGTDPSKALLVLGHYDSQPYSLGAADDGIALASMLESAQILKSHYTLKNDIIFLFTDAEEVGLLGAIAFAKDHPWVDEVGLCLNVEARGTRGAALSFEVSPQNGWIMKEFIRYVDHPFAGSMMYEVYKMMPNYTDFTIFKNKGISGFNVAIVEGYENYHSPTDKAGNLSLASLQHMGSYIMSIATHFGNLSLNNTKGDDLVYFNLIGTKMIFFPMSWNTIFFIFIIVLFVVLLYLGFARSELSSLKILISFIIFIATLAIAVGAVWTLNSLVKSIYPHYRVFYMSNSYNASSYFYAYQALTVAVSTLIFYFTVRRINIYNSMVSIFLLFILVSGIILLKIPTASYLTFVPLVFGLCAFNLILLFNLSPSNRVWIYYLLLFFGTVPFMLVISPYIYLIFHIFGLSLPIAGAGMLMLLLLILLPLLEGPLKLFKLNIPALSLLISVIFLFIAHFKSGYNEQKPLQSNVMYASLNDESKAYWLSSFTKTDEWNQQFFGQAREDSIPEFYPARGKVYLKNDADFMAFAKPEIALLNDSILNGVRCLEFNLQSMIDAGGQEVIIPPSYNLKSFSVNGIQVSNIEKMATRKEGYLFRIFSHGVDGININLEYEGEHPLRFSIIEKRLGLPPFSYITPMPSHIIKGVGYESHITLVKHKMEI